MDVGLKDEGPNPFPFLLSIGFYKDKGILFYLVHFFLLADISDPGFPKPSQG
jgi:hypothetical protein